MKKIFFLVTLMSFGFGSFAQDFIDNALLFSRTRPGGSARIQAVGGAQTALGGDFSSALSNPAGLGMYNRSEFTFSPAIGLHNNSSTYLGTTTDENKSVFHLPALSFVYRQESGKETGFMGGSFGITMTRINDFNRNFRYSGTNDQHSIIDYFINDATGIDPDDMLISNGNAGDYFYTLTGLAYNNYLIEDVPAGSTTYRSVLSPLPAEPPNFPNAEIRTIDQQEISESKGAQNQWSFSYGANFSDKFFIGAGLGVSSVRFIAKQSFKESNFRFSEDPSYQPIDYFQTNEEYDIRGSGVNFTLGAIVRPINFLQIGASLITPTYYSIIDSYDANIEGYWNIYNNGNPSFPRNRETFEEFGDPLVSEYKLKTPMRVNTGATFISQYGFITADVEFVDYSKTKYSSSFTGDFGSENETIKAEYQPVMNIRAGAEFRYEKYRVRAGFSHMEDPYKDDGRSQPILAITGGLGLRSKSFFVDLAAIFSSQERQRSPYFINGPDPVAFQKFNSTTIMATVGFTF